MRIEYLRPILIFLVILIHAERAFRGYAEMIRPEYKFISYVIYFFRGNFCRVAVPMFLAISGYLFSVSLPEIIDQRWYFNLLKKKTIRLLVPYLLFNIYLIVIVFYFSDIPGISGRIEPGLIQLLKKLIPFSSVPINFPLWFLRDLIIIYFFSPVVIIMLKEIPYFSIIVLWMFWNQTAQNGYGIGQSFFWFYLGCIIYYKKISMSFIDRYIFVICLFYIISTAGISYLNVMEYSIPHYKLFYNMNILLGCVVLWGLSKTLLIQNTFIEFFKGSSFFIYLMHEPILSILQNYLCKHFSFSSVVSQLLLFFGSAIFVFLLLGTIGHYMKRYKFLRKKEK